MNQEHRYIVAAEFRTNRSAAGSDDALVIEARICKYGALSQPNVPAPGARERFLAGAFRGSLAAGDDCVALYNHDQNSPLGRISNGTLKLHDSPDALTATIRLNPKVSAHQDIYHLAQDQTIKDCSFAFSANDGGEKWTQENDEDGRSYVLRSVSSAKLFDVSLLSAAPAYGSGATAVQARSLAYRFSAEPIRKLNGVFGPDGKIHLRLEEQILAQAYVIRKDQEAYEAAEQKRWASDREYQAWLASAEPVRLRRV